MSMATADRRDNRITTSQRIASSQPSAISGRMATAGRRAPTQRMAPVRSVRQESSGVSLAEWVVLDRSVGWSSDPRRSAAALRRGKDKRARLRGRIVLFFATILTLVGLVVAFGQLAGASDTSRPESPTVIMTVQAGDSLWTIAKSALHTADPRETVERIRKLNGLRDSVIVPGQQLIVPLGI
jgi:LysM repeat protein